ncbi:ARM repeat superfamily protein [Actinidia rufa]|uniref:ARM repeat superfamily protein n=1 Tax=Actinidia rufa TaxID=165716 RepID=A0A7J0DCZ7_9ERIC|nr:ARM repeat superfamily protein [Actinidia rufa]
MELQNTVKEALNALYHHPDDAVRMQADRWLQEFQRTIDAWQVSDNLLHDASSNQETLIFCSQTLRSKAQMCKSQIDESCILIQKRQQRIAHSTLTARSNWETLGGVYSGSQARCLMPCLDDWMPHQTHLESLFELTLSWSKWASLDFVLQTAEVQRDFEELPSEAFRPLRDSLNSLLKTFHKGPPKVRTQISLAVAALAVHVPAKDWGDGGIVNWLRDEMNSHPECIPSFLELLRVLPEEAFNYKIAARPDRRRQFEKELASAMEVALNILTACLSINELKEQVLEALASWLRLRHRIPASMLASHPLVLTALSSLNSDILLEASVNVISELIHYTAARNSGGVAAQMPLIQVIVPQVMSLKAQLRDSSKDEEDVKAIARLFADMGDSYLELIANGSDESMLIVHALLEVASHPEYDIASMTFNFWHNLQIHLIERDSYISFGNETSIEAERSRRLLGFRSSYESLVSLVSFRVKYPQDYADLSREDLKDFKQTRYDVADVLIDAALVLGGEATLKILYMKLVEAVGSCGNDEHSDWRPAEAALYCIWAISDYVSVTEAEVMPQMMSLLPKLPHQPQLLTTVCLTVGAYSKWLHAAPTGLSFLPSLIDILVSGMSMSEDSAAAAALAFRHICNGIDSPLQRQGFHSHEARWRILLGVSTSSGTWTPQGRASAVLFWLCWWWYRLWASGNRIRLLVLCLCPSLYETVLGEGTPAMVVPEGLQGSCGNRGEGTMPYGHEFRAAKGQFCNWLMSKCSRGLLVVGHLRPRMGIRHQPTSMPWITSSLTSPSVPLRFLLEDSLHLVEALSVVITEVPSDHAKKALEVLCLTAVTPLQEIINQGPLVLGQTPARELTVHIDRLANIFRYVNHPEAVADAIQRLWPIFKAIFDLRAWDMRTMESLCRACKNADFTSRPDIADDCFLLASREASNSILTFLSDIFDLAKSSQGEKYISIRDSVILPRGATITRILVASVTGALPSSRLETVIYALLALTRVYGPRAIEWAKDSVSLIPSTAVTEVERTRFLQALSDVASGIDINPLAIPIEELSEVCRRNRTVQEIVQGALRPLELNLVNGIVA